MLVKVYSPHMKRIFIVLPVVLLGLTFALFSNNSNAASHPVFFDGPPAAVDIFGVSLRDGDLIGASTFGDPDIKVRVLRYRRRDRYLHRKSSNRQITVGMERQCAAPC